MIEFDLSEITESRTDLNFEGYSLINNPFPMTGVSKENPEFYAGRDRTLDILQKFIIGSFNDTGWSGLVIIGENGMGKTHTLKFIRDQINQQLSVRQKGEKCESQYITMPISFEDIYIRIIKNLNQNNFISLLWEAISENFKSTFTTSESFTSMVTGFSQYFGESIDITDFQDNLIEWSLFYDYLIKTNISRQAMQKVCENFLKEVIYDKNMRVVCSKMLIDKEVHEECWRWLLGEKLYKEDKLKIGVSSDLKINHTVVALKSLVNVYRKSGYRRLFIMIDQFEDMIQQGDRTRLKFLIDLRDLIDSIPLSFSIILGSTPESWEATKQVHPAFSDRFSGPVDLYSLDVNQMKSLIEAYLINARINDYNGEKISPFSMEGIETIQEKSKGNPRHALEFSHILIEKGKNAGYRPIDKNFVMDNIEI